MRQYGGLEELILSVSRLRVFQNRQERRSKVSISRCEWVERLLVNFYIINIKSLFYRIYG